MPEAKEFILKNGDHITIKDETARNDIQTLDQNKIDKPEDDGISGQSLMLDDNGEIVWGNVPTGDEIKYDNESQSLYADGASGTSGSGYITGKVAPGKIQFSPSSLEFDDYTQTKTVQISNSTGTVELDSYNENDLNVELDDEGLLTISPKDGGLTETNPSQIDLFVKSSSGYSANLFSVPYIMKYNAPRVKFGEGTADQIQAIFESKNAGKINLDEFWHIGDERVIHLNAIPEYRNANNQLIVNAVPETDLIFVLLHKGLYLDENGQEVNYVIGTKNMPYATAMINYNTTNYPGWFDSDLNTYLQDYLYPALDDNDKPLFKQFICKANRNETNNRTTNTMESRVQKITIPSVLEIYPSTISTSQFSTIEAEQLTQFDWYAQNTSNRIKYYMNGSTKYNNQYYWLRSQYPTSKNAHIIGYGSNSTNATINTKYYITPQLCI